MLDVPRVLRSPRAAPSAPSPFGRGGDQDPAGLGGREALGRRHTSGRELTYLL